MWRRQESKSCKVECNKEAKKLGESSDNEVQQMRHAEETIFFPFVLKALLRMGK